jgi:hypothetical protein
MSCFADITRQEKNLEHLAEPVPGDYWHEMYNPILLVLARLDQSSVVICEPKDVSESEWTWDIDSPQRLTLNEFGDRLLYKTIPGTWADCVCSTRMLWAVAAFEQLHGQITEAER